MSAIYNQNLKHLHALFLLYFWVQFRTFPPIVSYSKFKQSTYQLESLKLYSPATCQTNTSIKCPFGCVSWMC